MQKIKENISKDIKQNTQMINEIFRDSTDIKKVEMNLGRDGDVTCLIVYIEVSVGNLLVSDSVIGKVLMHLCDMPGEQICPTLEKNHLGVADISLYQTYEEAEQGLLGGNILLFIDGYDRAVKVQDKGYPKMSLQEAESEKTVRGSNEGFSDSVKINSALIRKRVRTSKVKIIEKKAGVRSNTILNLVYIEDIVYPELLEEIEQRLERFEIDGVMDSGVIEQLSEEKWYSPFPQFQTTQRPDRAAMAILEGRIVLLCDNSPEALILPTDYSSFIRTADDYYQRWEIASLGRMIRYLASFLAMVLPGLYLAVTNFHTQVLPTSLLLSFAAARQGVPFPAVVEVLLMEISFELLREAGVRLPGAMGNTIGIVGGLIIGQAAVDANIVSPIVVIIIAFTALCSFTVPNEELASAFRILKFMFIALCAWLGFYGFLVGLLLVLIHLSQLQTFGIPYLMPFVGADLNQYEDERDLLVRYPIRRIRQRPVYAQRQEKIKLRWKPEQRNTDMKNPIKRNTDMKNSDKRNADMKSTDKK